MPHLNLRLLAFEAFIALAAIILLCPVLSAHPIESDLEGPSPGSARHSIRQSNSDAAARPPLQYTNIAPNIPVKAGTELRILPVGDSITVGYESSDGNGYRLGLQQDLSGS